MIQNEIARKYSQALFELAREEDNLKKYKEELKAIVDFIEETEDLKKIFYHPRVMPEDKKELLDNLLNGKVSKNLFNFLKLLVDKRREFYLKAIYKEFVKMVNEEIDLLEVEVTSAIELTPDLMEALASKLKELLDNEIVLRHEVDPQIIGGLVLKIGDKVIDGSIKNKLQSLADQIAQIPVSELGG